MAETKSRKRSRSPGASWRARDRRRVPTPVARTRRGAPQGMEPRFAPHRGRSGAGAEGMGRIAVDTVEAGQPGAQRVHERGLRIAPNASSLATVRQLIRAGTGIGVVPRMIGDPDPGPVRAGPRIEDLTETQHPATQADVRQGAAGLAGVPDPARRRQRKLRDASGGSILKKDEAGGQVHGRGPRSHPCHSSFRKYSPLERRQPPQLRSFAGRAQ